MGKRSRGRPKGSGGPPKERLTAYLPRELVEQVFAAARRERVPASLYVENVLRRHFGRPEA